jgi:hypothetical protein
MKLFEYIKHEVDVEKLPEIPRPVPSDRLTDCVP